MKPIKGQKVKILFRNGTIESGIIESWSEKDAVIKANDSNNFLIIQNTSQDVMAIKIILEDSDKIKIKNEENNIITEKDVRKIDNELDRVIYEEKISDEEKREYIPDISLRAKKLAELRIEQARLEKEKISKKLLKPDLGKVQAFNYELPSSIFTKDTGPLHNTRKKS